MNNLEFVQGEEVVFSIDHRQVVRKSKDDIVKNDTLFYPILEGNVWGIKKSGNTGVALSEIVELTQTPNIESIKLLINSWSPTFELLEQHGFVRKAGAPGFQCIFEYWRKL